MSRTGNTTGKVDQYGFAVSVVLLVLAFYTDQVWVALVAWLVLWVIAGRRMRIMAGG